MRQKIKIPERRKADFKNTRLVLNQPGWAVSPRSRPTEPRNETGGGGGREGHSPGTPHGDRDRDGTAPCARPCVPPPTPLLSGTTGERRESGVEGKRRNPRTRGRPRNTDTDEPASNQPGHNSRCDFFHRTRVQKVNTNAFHFPN